MERSPSELTSSSETANKHEDLKIACMYCAKDFPTLESMCHHVSIYHGDVANGVATPDYVRGTTPKRNGAGTPLVGCDRCTMHFDSVKKLSEHLASVHWRPAISQKDRDMSNSPSQTSSFANSLTPYQSQPTDLSHKKRSDENSSAEYRNSKKPKREDGHKDLGSSSVSVSSYEAEDKPCICSCCYAQMPNFKSFLVHMENHVAVSQASASATNNSFLRYCPICGEPGRDPVGFSNHVFAHAITNVPGRCCHTCKKSFDGREELQKHLADVHILSVFKCSICNETFDTKVAIQVSKDALYILVFK